MSFAYPHADAKAGAQGSFTPPRAHRVLGIGLAVLLAASLASPASAQEDAAHRTDRLRTQALNRSAGRAVSGRDRVNARERARYEAASDAYARAMAQWHRRVDACERGDRDAC